MAWVEARGGRFLVRWREGAAKRHTWASTRQDAEEVKASVERGLAGAPRGSNGARRWVRLEDYARRVLQEVDTEQTRYHYTCAARVHILPRLGHRAVWEIESDDVRDLLAELRERGLGGHQRHRVYLVLSRLFKAAVNEGLISAGQSPMLGVGAPRKEFRAVDPLEPEQVERLAEHVPAHYRVPILVGAYAGLRIGEVGALPIDAVDFSGPEIRVVASVALAGGRAWVGEPKTATSRRAVPIPRFLADEIGGHVDRFPLTPNGRVFRSKYGGLLTGHLMSQALRGMRHQVGLPRVTFHILRHTYAALLIREGAHPKVIQTLMGHSSIRTTLDLYGHLFPGMGREWVDRLERRRRPALSLEPSGA